jgi:hypothetical protein
VEGAVCVAVAARLNTPLRCFFVKAITNVFIDFIASLAMIAYVIAIIWLIVWLFKTVGEMARRRGHNPWPWWLLSLAWSPFAVMLILWVFFDVEVKS